jgi:hypothetical protein
MPSENVQTAFFMLSTIQQGRLKAFFRRPVPTLHQTDKPQRAHATPKANHAPAQDVGTISFVKTKRNRTHDTHRPSETFFQTACADIP